MVNEVEQKMAVIDDFTEEDELIGEEFQAIGFGVADEREVYH